MAEKNDEIENCLASMNQKSADCKKSVADQSSTYSAEIRMLERRIANKTRASQTWRDLYQEAEASYHVREREKAS